jgi:membrane protein required for colicin V production
MTAFDYAVLAVIAASVLLGLWRGVVSEVLALAAWVVAFFVARVWAAGSGEWLAGDGRTGDASGGGLCAGFFAVLLAFALARMLISLMLKAVGLGLLDRLLGGAFGVLRGILSGGVCGAGGGDDALAEVRLVARGNAGAPWRQW